MRVQRLWEWCLGQGSSPLTPHPPLLPNTLDPTALELLHPLHVCHCLHTHIWMSVSGCPASLASPGRNHSWCICVSRAGSTVGPSHEDLE